MAVLDLVPGLKVEVCIDGEPVKEYDDDEENEPNANLSRVAVEWQTARTVSKYIESISDAEFSVKISLETPYLFDSPSLEIAVYVDGKLMDLPLITRKNFGPYRKGPTVEYPISRVVKGRTAKCLDNPGQQFVQNFKFAKIETTVDDAQLRNVKDDAKRISDVGEILVQVYRSSEPVKENVTSSSNTVSQGEEGADLKVHEKALKGQAKSHVTALGTASLSKTTYFRTDRLDGDSYPTFISRFKYRSRDALKSLLIIERTPTPEPEPEAPISLENLSAERRAQVARFLRDLDNEETGGTPGPSIKRERGTIIKRENDDNGRGGPPRKKIKSRKSITIDLTEDSDEENIEPLK